MLAQKAKLDKKFPYSQATGPGTYNKGYSKRQSPKYVQRGAKRVEILAVPCENEWSRYCIVYLSEAGDLCR